MALIVEDGTNVPNADSYISEADAIVRAGLLGLEFPSLDGDAETPLRRAAIKLDQYRSQYQGVRVFADQSLQWPRDPVYIDGVYNDPAKIPQELIDAQVALASIDYAGGNIFGTSLGSATSRSVGDVSVTNSNSGALDNSTYSGFVAGLLAPLMKGAENGLLEFDVCRA
jgi:hypothetical protein